MTIAQERMNSIRSARLFLERLCNPKETPRVPKEVRKWAHQCLRHYPNDIWIDAAWSHYPEVFDDVPRKKVRK